MFAFVDRHGRDGRRTEPRLALAAWPVGRPGEPPARYPGKGLLTEPGRSGVRKPCGSIQRRSSSSKAQKAMKLASVRLIAADIRALVSFYEMVTGVSASWLAPVFAEIVTPGATLAIGAQETVALWSEGSAEPCANRTACLEFQVEDVDADYARLKDRVSLVHELKTMPWGNRTFQFRDPEGTAVSLYMPATEAAKARFAAR